MPLDERAYSILINPGLLGQLGNECRKIGLGHRCAILTDTHVAALYARKAELSLRSAGFEPVTITVPAGEKSKSLHQAGACFDALASARLERKSFIVALGGGVVGDLAGFLAATYLRGIAFVQVPTTLLAQVDSSVGGKVGINLPAGKNLVGAFYQPRLVLCDLATLGSLPNREFCAGLAEIIKYGIIYDANLFRFIEKELDSLLRRNLPILSKIVSRCCSIKSEVVTQDETESGLRAILNFGHTIGHGLEAISGYGKFLHGEAISIGQVAAAKISAQYAGLPKSEAGRIQNLFQRAGLPTQIRLNRSQWQRLLAAMRLDKKVSGGELKFVLAQRIGKVIWGQPVPDTAIAAALDIPL